MIIVEFRQFSFILALGFIIGNEVKTAPTVRGCLREAIGQLLEYALWPGATPPNRLIVVGEPALDNSAMSYLATLNQSFPIPISYRQLALD